MPERERLARLNAAARSATVASGTLALRPAITTVSPRVGETTMTQTIEAHLPRQLLHEAEAFVREGWSSDMDSLLSEALRRYLESHQPRLTESLVREDVEWGLRGDE